VATGRIRQLKDEEGGASLYDDGERMLGGGVRIAQIHAPTTRGRFRCCDRSHRSDEEFSFREPNELLTRWIVQIQMFRFSVCYSRGYGELMAVPDAFSRDTMDPEVVLCHQCLEAFQEVTEGPVRAEEDRVLSPEEVRKFQIDEYGMDGEKLEGEDYVRDEDGIWCRVFGRNDVRVLARPIFRE
jgi:hypothetical protein